MSKPVRIQMVSRTGFSLYDYSRQLNGLEVVVIGGRSRWANPFKVIGDMIFFDASYRRKILDKLVLLSDKANCDVSDSVKIYSELLHDINSHPEVEKEIIKKMSWIIKNIDMLKNKNVACWCSESDCCHGDVLLKLANN
jgi:hypothetical protein